MLENNSSNRHTWRSHSTSWLSVTPTSRRASAQMCGCAFAGALEPDGGGQRQGPGCGVSRCMQSRFSQAKQSPCLPESWRKWDTCRASGPRIVLEPLREEVDQDPHLGRQIAAVRIDREYAAIAGTKSSSTLTRRPACRSSYAMKSGQRCDTQSGKCCRQRHTGAVGLGSAPRRRRRSSRHSLSGTASSTASGHWCR